MSPDITMLGPARSGMDKKIMATYPGGHAYTETSEVTVTSEVRASDGIAPGSMPTLGHLAAI